MLSVSFSPALVATMLFGIKLPGNPKEVDKFNGPTYGPIPASIDDVVSSHDFVKGQNRLFFCRFGGFLASPLLSRMQVRLVSDA